MVLCVVQGRGCWALRLLVHTKAEKCSALPARASLFLWSNLPLAVLRAAVHRVSPNAASLVAGHSASPTWRTAGTTHTVTKQTTGGSAVHQDRKCQAREASSLTTIQSWAALTCLQ